MTWTTYCMRHEVLETVDEVTDIKRFAEEELWPDRIKAYEVWGVTNPGCKVHFVGGPKWKFEHD